MKVGLALQALKKGIIKHTRNKLIQEVSLISFLPNCEYRIRLISEIAYGLTVSPSLRVKRDIYLIAYNATNYIYSDWKTKIVYCKTKWFIDISDLVIVDISSLFKDTDRKKLFSMYTTFQEDLNLELTKIQHGKGSISK